MIGRPPVSPLFPSAPSFRSARVDRPRQDGRGDRVEPLEPRIDLLGGGGARGESRHDQAGAEPAPVQRHEPPTVTTELGVPNSSSRATGAAGSATQLTPSTRNAYR